MFLKNLETNVLKYMDPSHFLSTPGLTWQACLKKAKINLELVTDINMLLMIEAGIGVGMFQAVYRHVKANNKYMKIMIKALNHHI